MAKQKRDQQAADAAVAIEKGVNRFELKVSERRFHQRRRIGMQELFELSHATLHILRRRRYKCCVAWASTSDPVLRLPKLARRLLRTASGCKENFVHLTQQPIGQRKAVAQSLQAMCHRLHIARYFSDIPYWYAGRFAELVCQ